MRIVGSCLLFCISIHHYLYSQPTIQPIPSTYYSTAEGLIGANLKQALHDIIDNHTIIWYSQTDEAFQNTEADYNTSGNVILLYSRDSAPRVNFEGIAGNPNGTYVWNREHQWPRSRGIFNDDGADNSDLFNLRPCYKSINSARGNLYFDESDSSDPGYVSSYNLASEASSDTNSWEPPDEIKGEVARSMFYMAVRYDGSDFQTQDLEIVENPVHQFSSSLPPEMGRLSMFLEWHRNYPVSDRERIRNQVIYNSYQGNRNPFIDYPDLVDAVFTSDECLTIGTWRIMHFTFAELLDPLISGNDADPDGDGICNIKEFAFNMDPRVATTDGLPSLIYKPTGLSWQYRQIKEANKSHISYQLLGSLNLQQWVSINIQNLNIIVTDEGYTEWVDVDVTTYMDTYDAYFFEVKVD